MLWLLLITNHINCMSPLEKPIGVRLKKSTKEYFEKQSTDDKRELSVFIRLVLEDLETKGYVWRQPTTPPPTPGSPNPGS